MTIDPFQDTLIPLAKVARSLPHPPSPAAIWRWHRHGIGGVRLEIVRVGGRLYTTPEAWREFVRATTGSRENLSDKKPQTGERSESAKNRLRNAGLI